MRVPPLREWTLLGRPIGEWVFGVGLLCIGANELLNAARFDARSVWQWSVPVAQVGLAVSAVGIVAAIVIGARFGLVFTWLFAALATGAAAMTTWTIIGAPPAEVLTAGISAAAIGAFIIWYGRRRLFAAITRREWASLLVEHEAAASAFVQALQRVPNERWTRRADPDGWSPAEITDHLARTYSHYAGESRGKDSLRKRLGPMRRMVARIVVLPRLLAGAPFPKARAPRKLRPAESTTTPDEGVALFLATGESCLRDLGVLVERRPYRTLVHPYLGAVPLYEMLRFASQHIHHHRRQLVGILDALAAQEQRNDVAS